MQDIFKSKSSKGRSLRYGEGRTRNGDSIQSDQLQRYITTVVEKEESRRIPRAPLRGRGVRERRGLLSDFIPESSAGAIKRARDTS